MKITREGVQTKAVYKTGCRYIKPHLAVMRSPL